MMKASDRLALALREWGSALRRLEEALALPRDLPLLLDGTMQRFEFCFELAWKSLKLALAEREGLEVASPRQALQRAFALGWIEEEAWLRMLQDQNLSSHTYRQPLADEIFSRIPQHANVMRQLERRLAN